ncbi:MULTISPECIES: hypothetical protein [Aeromonas]|nr:MULTISPECIES: hypothetical protein [Aeromonas]MCX7126923.1 hypothetical protein [Aeromonas sp.]
MQNFDAVNWLIQQTAFPAWLTLANGQQDGAKALWQVTHAG